MNAAMPQQGEPLQAQVDEALEKLGGLERNLQSITGELDALSLQREQHALLEQTCGSLERLGELGALKLLFGDDVDTSRVAGHLDRAKQRLASFRDQLAEIESRRHAVAEELTAGRQVLAILEDDLDEQREEEEEARNEWVVERDVGSERVRLVAMPWVGGAEDDRRLGKALRSAFAAALLFGVLIPLIDIPLPEAAEVIEVPARLVELIRERRPPPPPQLAEERPQQRAPDEPPEPTPDQEPQQVAAAQPQPEPTEVPAGEDIPDAPPGQRARESGILAFRESFAAAASRPAARLGTDARITSGGDSAVGRSERAMVTTLAQGSSGGINLGALSRGLGSSGGEGGGAGLAGVTTTRVAGVIGGGGGGGGGGRPIAGGGGLAGRTDEEIQIEFDRYKASLYRLYNRELRNDPSLRGQMVLRLTIEPSGVVSFLELQSSDMNAPALAAQVLERVRTFDFGAKDVAAITIVYPIDFLPAA
jgi:outer membrane biosynthesis protein TonB